MTSSDFIVLFARPRSGTNALRSVLATHPDVFCLDEVFAITERGSEHELTRSTNFFNFLVSYAGGDVERIYPNRHAAVFADFLEYLGGFTTKRFIVIDVKYTTAHLLTAPYGSLDHPYLFDLIVANQLRVLHIARKNYLRYELSLRKAIASGKWETELHEAPSDQPISLDVPSLIHSMGVCEREDEIVRTFFRGYGRYLSFDYQDVFSPGTGTLAGQFLDEVSRWLDVPTRYVNAPTTRKQSYLPLRETITNFEEVEEALRQSRFAYCLEDEYR